MVTLRSHRPYYISRNIYCFFLYDVNAWISRKYTIARHLSFLFIKVPKIVANVTEVGAVMSLRDKIS